MSSRMGRVARNITTAHLFCSECNNKTNIQRLNRRLKSNGHIKDLWCFKCQKTTKHVEKREDQINEEYLEKIWSKN